MEITGYTRMAAVVANPIKHSLSPFIHNQAFSKTQTDGVYLAWEVELADFPAMIKNVKILDMYGLNLSMPYKQVAMPYMDELTAEARLIGAINTVALKEGKLIGHNTDGIGFFKALVVDDFSIAQQEMTILGGGGAANAIIAQAALKHARKINVFARKSSSFGPLKQRLENLSALTETEIRLFELPSALTESSDEKFGVLQAKIADSQLLVNATSVGMDGKSLPLPEKIALPADLVVVDVIYKILQTPFLKWANSQGVKTFNGLGMLIYQAAESFEMWTGKMTPVEEIRNALEEKLFLPEKSV